MPITVFLRSPLFAPRDGAAAPARAMVLTGSLHEDGLSGGLTLTVQGWADQDGRSLSAPARKLFVPYAKIDHALLED